MIDIDAGANDDERLALAAFKAMEDGTFTDAMAALCTEDFLWANSGLPTLSGQQVIREHMARGGFTRTIPILAAMTSFSADLVHIASRGGVVFTERIDHHWDADGRDLMTPHIAGVIEIRDSRICALRDFYDTVCYQQEPTAPDPAHAQRSGSGS
jgi:limonene-1,2-epoxide hydrolase